MALLALLFLFVTSAFGEPEAFWAARARGLPDAGALAEIVAAAEYERRYPTARYQIWRSVEYVDRNGKTLGELDIVVLDRRTDRVVDVGEVKLTADPASGAEKSREQTATFLDALKARRVARIHLRGNRGTRLYAYQFENVKKFTLIGPKGAGYDVELPFTYRETLDIFERANGCGPAYESLR